MAAGHVVEIAVLTYRGWPDHSRRAINRMAFHSHRAGTKVVGPVEYGNALVHRARNEVLAHVGEDVTHLLFVDDDMVPFEDALERLLIHSVPVVAALYASRHDTPELVVRAYDERSCQFARMEAMRPGLHTGKFGVATGFLLLRRDVVEAVVKDYLTAADWLEENRRMLDRLHVRVEYREKEQAHKAEIRQARWERDKYLRVFDFPVGDDEIQKGEDIALSSRLIRLKIPIAVDASIQVGHLGERVFTPDDVQFSRDDMTLVQEFDKLSKMETVLEHH
jgi:hypothetical protein